MNKVSGKVQAKTWQPTPKPQVQKSGFAARAFPSLEAQQERQSSQGQIQRRGNPPVVAPKAAIGMLANVNRAIATDSATDSTTTSPGVTVQAKLTIGAPGDKYEQEADRVAKQVVQRLQAPASPPVAPPTGDGTEPTVQRQVAIPIMQRVTAGVNGSQGAMPADAGFEAQLQRSRSGGSPLDAAFRAKVEPLMGADFSGVRVHTDGNSDRLARSIQAKAFTTGQDMYFSKGAYEPGSWGGQELLAHELTHVVQQKGKTRKTNREENDATHLSESHGMGKSVGSMLQRILLTPPERREQQAGTCGVYSLWMAYEAIHGREQNFLEAFRGHTENWTIQGEIFTREQLQYAILCVNEKFENGLELLEIPIIDQQDLYAQVRQIDLMHTGAVIMVAYDYNSLDHNRRAGQDAHWSIIATIDEVLPDMEIVDNERNIGVWNPHGRVGRENVASVLYSSIMMGATNAMFNWELFAEECLGVINEENRDIADIIIDLPGTEWWSIDWGELLAMNEWVDLRLIEHLLINQSPIVPVDIGGMMYIIRAA